MMRRFLAAAVVVLACTSGFAPTNASAQPASGVIAADSSPVHGGTGVGGDGGTGTVNGTDNQGGGTGSG
ncbi:MAG TPA: hypothetical protein VFG00_09405, partial [Acidothermaceae bacterium]|nr:hypothetical protein [Acidothermaceae bacterium]